MQVITISGTLLDDAVKCVDKNGRSYTRFKMTCGASEPGGRTVFTHYQCTCYIDGYEKLKKGDQAFVCGKFSARLTTDEKGKQYMNLNVLAFQATGGYKYTERKDKKD